MIPAKNIFESHTALSNRLEEAAAQHDFDIKFLQNGGVVAPGGYYKLLKNTVTGQLALVAVHDPDDLTGKPGTGGWLYPKYPEKLRVVKTYDAMPALHQEIRSDIVSDRPQWFDFMLRYGNLIEIPALEDGVTHFKNDFASYVACPILEDETENGKPAYDIYAYFDAYGHHTRPAAHPEFIERWGEQLQSVKFKGIYLGRVEGGKKDAAKFVHKDFCHKFLRFLEGKNPLSLEDVGHSPARSFSMFANNKLASFEIKKLLDFDWWLEVAKIIVLLDPRDLIFAVAHLSYKLFRKLRGTHGRYFEALLPSSHSGYEQHSLPVEGAANWRILTAQEARLHPLGTPVYKDLADGWLLEGMLSAIQSSTPCLVQHVGNQVISIQKPDGSKLYYGPEGEVYIVYAPEKKIEAMPDQDPCMFEVPDKHRAFYEAGKIVCLRVKHNDVSVKDVPRPQGASYEIERIALPEDTAYAQIASMAGCAADLLKHEDNPGMPHFIAAQQHPDVPLAA